jgi:hypothetical protein
MKYQATVKTSIGVQIATIEAENKDEAKYKFLEGTVTIDGRKTHSFWVDLRTVKKCSNSLQSKRKEGN